MSRTLIPVLVVLLLGAVLALDDRPREKDKEGSRDGGGAAASTGAPEAPAKKNPEQDPAKGALEGKVLFDGPMPELKAPEIRPDHLDRAACIDHVKNEKLLLSDKKEVKDVVVSVAGYKPQGKVEPRTLTLDNKNCTFVPHVQATTVGSTLKVTNSDAFIHNTHGVLALNFNNAVAPGGSFEKVLKKPDWGVVQCDFHTWMQAHIWVFAHDLFDVTGPDGAYKIPNIPPGEYEITFWHEHPLQPQKLKVKIEAGKTARLDATLGPMKK